MADFKISELTNHTPASSDDMIINDNSTPSSPETKRTTVASLASIIGTLIGDSGGDGSGNNSFFDPIYFYDTAVKTASVPSGSGGIRGWHTMSKSNIAMHSLQRCGRKRPCTSSHLTRRRMSSQGRRAPSKDSCSYMTTRSELILKCPRMATRLAGGECCGSTSTIL